MPTPRMNRRDFLGVAGAATSMGLLSSCGVRFLPAGPAHALPKRVLGKTKEELSVVGFGGIVVRDETPEQAKVLVTQAVERGINYFDVAPSYGNAQERLGPALEPYRKSVFLACKTQQRDNAGAERELRRSMELLRTDHLDLYQFHAVTQMREVDAIFGPGGAMETFLQAREKGLIRYIGFSAHSEQAALAMLDRFSFDTILYPINWVCWHQGNFGPAVLDKARAKGMGILALKALAKETATPAASQRWPKCWYTPADDAEMAALSLRFTLSRPVTAAVSPSHAELLWWACDAASNLQPLSKEEETKLAQLSQGLKPLFHA